MNFTLRQLEYAVAASRYQHIGKAAKACFVSQPSLSSQLLQLEKTLGQTLFERGSSGVTLTPFGESFIPEAKHVLAQALRLEDQTRAAKEPLTTKIRLGVIPTIAPFVLPHLIPIVHERHPQATICLEEAETGILLERLARRELDVLLLALEADLGRVETKFVLRDSFIAALHKDHPLSTRATISLSELDKEQLLLLSDGHCLSHQIQQYCALQTGFPTDDFRASSLMTLIQMVAMGMGITLLPAIARDSKFLHGSGIQFRSLTESAYRTVGLAWRPGCPRRNEFELLAMLIEEVAPSASTGMKE